LREYSQGAKNCIADSQGEGRAEMLYIRYRGVELKLPIETDMDAVATVLRSVQQMTSTSGFQSITCFAAVR